MKPKKTNPTTRTDPDDRGGLRDLDGPLLGGVGAGSVLDGRVGLGVGIRREGAAQRDIWRQSHGRESRF